MTALFDRIPESVFRIFSFLIITILLSMILFPLYFMLTTAFKFDREIYSMLTWVPREPTLNNFRDVIVNFRIPLYLRNTLIVAVSTTPGGGARQPAARPGVDGDHDRRRAIGCRLGGDDRVHAARRRRRQGVVQPLHRHDAAQR